MSIAISSSTSAASIGLSGMRAAQLRLDASAHNVANVQTPASSAQGPGGFDRLADDMVDQRMSLYSFAANLRTVQTQDAMLGALLDVRA